MPHEDVLIFMDFIYTPSWYSGIIEEVQQSSQVDLVLRIPNGIGATEITFGECLFCQVQVSYSSCTCPILVLFPHFNETSGTVQDSKVVIIERGWHDLV
jgi:hypothetical protein